MGQASRLITVYSPEWVPVQSFGDDDDYPIEILVDQGRLILRRSFRVEEEDNEITWSRRVFKLLGNYAAGYSVQVEEIPT